MANPRLAQTLPIYKQTYELLLMIVKARKQFSREYRYDLGEISYHPDTFDFSPYLVY